MDLTTTWQIVGGAEKGGLLVRKDRGLRSDEETTRLATGSSVAGIETDGNRLHYKLLDGSGPESGWISIRNKDKPLVVKVQMKKGKTSKPVWREKSLIEREALLGEVEDEDTDGATCVEMPPATVPAMVEKSQLMPQATVPAQEVESQLESYATVPAVLAESQASLPAAVPAVAEKSQITSQVPAQATLPALEEMSQLTPQAVVPAVVEESQSSHQATIPAVVEKPHLMRHVTAGEETSQLSPQASAPVVVAKFQVTSQATISAVGEKAQVTHQVTVPAAVEKSQIAIPAVVEEVPTEGALDLKEMSTMVDQTSLDGLSPQSAESMLKNHKIQATIAGAASGAILVGSASGVAGAVCGGAIGAAVGTPAAVFTFGLSIPAAAVIGSGTGLCAGATAGGSAGLVGGGAVGYGAYSYRKELQQAATSAIETLKQRTPALWRRNDTCLKGAKGCPGNEDFGGTGEAP